jgi:pentatricopeptide repeat protein
VHIATQKLSTMRRKRNGRGESPDPEDVWCEFENLLADGHRPTVKTYTSLLAALGDMGAPEDAEEVLVRMRDAGEAPDAQAYNAAVHAWCANGKPGEAERVVERMLGDGVRPNASTYPDIVTAYAKMGELRRCESIISRIESVCDEEGAALRWYEKVYHALIRGLLRAGPSGGGGGRAETMELRAARHGARGGAQRADLPPRHRVLRHDHRPLRHGRSDGRRAKAPIADAVGQGGAEHRHL